MNLLRTKPTAARLQAGARRLLGLGLLIAMVAGYNAWQRPGEMLAARVTNYVPRADKVIALTFDDGPHPVITALLLDILRRHGVHATFHVVGVKAREAPDLIRRMVAGGHEVESHTYSHDNLDHLTPSETLREIVYADNALRDITGHAPTAMRPPGGEYNVTTVQIMNQLHHTFALWSVNPGDWKKPPPHEIVETVMKQAAPGAIVLLHDDALETVEALPLLLDDLKRDGYRCVTTRDLETSPPVSDAP